MIRKAIKEDIDAVSGIYSMIHTEEECGKAAIGWVRDIYPTTKTTEDSFGRGDLFVEIEGDTVVGSAIINHMQPQSYKEGKWEFMAPADEVMVLHTLVIDPHFSGRGFGRHFIEFYENYAFSQNCHYLRIDTQDINHAARSMYRKMNYKEIGIVPCEFNGIEGVNLVLMEKRITTTAN